MATITTESLVVYPHNKDQNLLPLYWLPNLIGTFNDGQLTSVLVEPENFGTLMIQSGNQLTLSTKLEPNVPVKVFVGPGDSIRASHEISGFDGRILDPEVLVTIPQGNKPFGAIVAHNTGLDGLELYSPDDWFSGVAGVTAYRRDQGNIVEPLDR